MLLFGGWTSIYPVYTGFWGFTCLLFIAHESEWNTRMENMAKINSDIIWIFVSPQNSYVKMLMPNAMMLGEAFGRCLGHEGWALMNGVSVLKKRLQRPLVTSTLWGPWKGTSYEPGRWPLSEHNHGDPFILDFPSLKTARNKFLLFMNYPICGILF